MEGKNHKQNKIQAKMNQNRTKISQKTMLNNDIKILIFKLYFKFKLGKYTVVLVHPPALIQNIGDFKFTESNRTRTR